MRCNPLVVSVGLFLAVSYVVLGAKSPAKPSNLYNLNRLINDRLKRDLHNPISGPRPNKGLPHLTNLDVSTLEFL